MLHAYLHECTMNTIKIGGTSFSDAYFSKTPALCVFAPLSNTILCHQYERNSKFCVALNIMVIECYSANAHTLVLREGVEFSGAKGWSLADQGVEFSRAKGWSLAERRDGD